MKYLLLGNGPLPEQAGVIDADLVVQFNLCVHRARVPPFVRRYVFISNTGAPAEQSVAFFVENKNDPTLAGAVVMCARNPTFYRLKRCALKLFGSEAQQHYTVSPAPRELHRIAVVETMSFLATLRLETRMREEGMTASMMPSTGMIAFDWVVRGMRPGDRLAIAGFSWEGWEGHPWEIERRIMRGGGK